MAAKKRSGRRQRLVPDTGIECFEVRIVQWIDEDGNHVTSAEISTPDGDDNTTLNEVVGSISLGRELIRDLYRVNGT